MRLRDWEDGVMAAEIVATAEEVRKPNLSSAIRWCTASLTWSVLAGSVAVLAGATADSTALLGFGLESLLDAGASGVLVWRFMAELERNEPPHHLERTAARVVGLLLALVVLYLVVRATIALATHSGPSATTAGVSLTALSIVVLPLLARAKLRLARDLESPALRADGVLSAGGTGLAAATLIGLALSTGLDLWWADSVAALLIAGILGRESIATLRASRSLTT
jgi:divalent metal cation (Fe/Co/Zn/Cd) transporter